MPPDERARSAGLAVYGCDPEEARLFHDLAPCYGLVPTIVPEPLSATGVLTSGGRCVSVGHTTQVSRGELQALRSVGVEHLSTRSIGVDHIDLVAADELGIAVEGVAYSPDGVADFTVMLVLMAIRGAKPAITAIERRDVRLPAAPGRDLRDLTVGVVGAGSIGSAVIRRLHGFGCRILVHTVGRPPAGVESIALDTLLCTSDVVTLHVPLDATTHHLVGAAEIAAMKRGAVLVNTSRGAVVDTAALTEALEAGHLGGAALDVIEGEDGCFVRGRGAGDVDHPFLPRLLAMPNVVVTPHSAFRTHRALREIVEGTLANCAAFERGRVRA